MTKADAHLLGLEIGGTHVRVAVASGARILASRIERWHAGLSPDRELSWVAELALSLARAHSPNIRLLAAGVAAAALLDDTGAVLQWPNRPAWRGLPLKDSLRACLGLPVFIEDDANAAALAEATLGAGRSYTHLLVLTIGTGVGAGLILDKRLFRGRHGWAGELGHIVMQTDGPRCPCGKRGCLQMLASGRAFERLAAERGLRGGGVAVTNAALAGEAWAVEAVHACGRWLGLAVANAVDLLDLEAVVIGGGLGRQDAPLWRSLQETMQAHLLNAAHKQVALRGAELGEMAGLMGAVLIARQGVLPILPCGGPTKHD